jgi:hypothetical protein
MLKNTGFTPLDASRQEQLKYGNMIHLLLAEINFNG